jgi:DNA-binding response OmpR family regulator
MRILAVDDEKNIRLMLDECLSSEGYTVETAVSGEHAVEKFAQSAYDVVLLDMKMPGLDGIEVLRRLKHMANDVPVIMITGYGSIETAVETMKLGAVDYLRKPFTPAEIRAAVAAVLQRRTLTEDRIEGADDELAFAKNCIVARQLDKAAEHLKHAIAANPQQPEAFNLLGALNELNNDLAAAQSMYRAALALAPNFRPARENLDRTAQMRYTREGMSLGDAGDKPEPGSSR